MSLDVGFAHEHSTAHSAYSPRHVWGDTRVALADDAIEVSLSVVGAHHWSLSRRGCRRSICRLCMRCSLVPFYCRGARSHFPPVLVTVATDAARHRPNRRLLVLLGRNRGRAHRNHSCIIHANIGGSECGLTKSPERKRAGHASCECGRAGCRRVSRAAGPRPQPPTSRLHVHLAGA